MLTKGDIDFIKSVREEIRINRKKNVVITGTNIVGSNPITGEIINNPFSEEVEAVVTEVSVRTAVDRYLNEGVEVRTGDIIVDISLIDLPSDITDESIDNVIHGGKSYKVITSDYLGMGEDNRLEVIGRREK